MPKIVFWKKHYWVATTTDCFEPIFGFLGQFCFEKHRSASWSRIRMFSELSGRSDMREKKSYSKYPMDKLSSFRFSIFSSSLGSTLKVPTVMWVECLFFLWPWLSQLIFLSGYWKQLLSTHDQIYQSKRNIWSIHGKKSSWNARKSRNWFKQVLKHVSYFVR